MVFGATFCLSKSSEGGPNVRPPARPKNGLKIESDFYAGIRQPTKQCPLDFHNACWKEMQMEATAECRREQRCPKTPQQSQYDRVT